jgi:tetratricopeptide (TPR) repeat protein
MTQHLQEQLRAAISLHQTGDHASAEQAYRLILEEAPATADALHMLGILEMQHGRMEASLGQIMEALALEPTNPYFQKSLANVFLELKQRDRAIAAFTKALTLKPDYLEALLELGRTLENDRRFEDAASCFTRALNLHPDSMPACLGLGRVLRATDQFEPAKHCFCLALRVDPSSVDASVGLGELYLARRNYAEAMRCLTSALALNPDSAPLLNGMGNVYRELGQIDDAMKAYALALSANPGEAAVHFNIAGAHTALGAYPEAVASYSQAIRLNPDYVEAHANKALLQLMLGDLAGGWEEYEWRFKMKDPSQKIDNRTFDRPVWDGSDFSGKTLLLRAEQGVGDMIQFSRYAPLVRRRGGTVVLECPPRLGRLFRGAAGVDAVVERQSVPPVDFDLYIPLLSVPRFFTRSVTDIPALVPYLAPEPETVERTRALFTPGEFNVGICWQGNRGYKGDGQRSIPLRAFLPLLQTPGVRFYSLQKGEGSDQIHELPPCHAPVDLSPVLDNGADAFIETAGAMQYLDLIISSDTALPHLAGALGRPVWVLLPHTPEWRWLLDRDDSPWYPTMRLFRQQKPGDWASVVEPAARQLASLARRGAPS